MVFELCEQTDRQTDVLIAILHSLDGTHVGERSLDFVEITELFIHSVLTSGAHFDVVAEDDGRRSQLFSFKSLYDDPHSQTTICVTSMTTLTRPTLFHGRAWRGLLM